MSWRVCAEVMRRDESHCYGGRVNGEHVTWCVVALAFFGFLSCSVWLGSQVDLARHECVKVAIAHGKSAKECRP